MKREWFGFIKKTKKYLIIENKYYIMSLDKDVKGRCALNCTFSLASSFFYKQVALERQTNVKNGGLL